MEDVQINLLSHSLNLFAVWAQSCEEERVVLTSFP